VMHIADKEQARFPKFAPYFPHGSVLTHDHSNQLIVIISRSISTQQAAAQVVSSILASRGVDCHTSKIQLDQITSRPSLRHFKQV
jgi:hypothetical protein